MLKVLFTFSLLENFVADRNSLRGPNKWKSEEARSGLQGGCGSCLQPNSLMVSIVLAAVWGLALSWWNPMTTDLRKGKVIMYNSQVFRNVLYCNSSISQNEHINWIHHFRCAQHCGPAWFVFILNTILIFFNQFKRFVTLFGKVHMVCTS